MTTNAPDLRNTAVIFTCDLCAAEFFPNPLPTVGELFGPDHSNPEMHPAIVHAACAADFVANGFEIVGEPEDDEGPELFCPHYKWDAAADEWKKAL